MRREHICFYGGIPVNIELLNIKNIPFNWHNSIELLYVLKGEVDVTIDSESCSIKQGEVEIINVDEAHTISSKEDNLVLMFNIDTEFLKNYYKDIDDVFFYTDNTSQEEEEKYDVLKRYLSNIFYEMIRRGEEFEIEIQSNVVSLLFHLVNEFHYLTVEDSDLKDKEIQLERYHRITKYIYTNYMNKISLKDIADKEFLSIHYLSHELKNRFGYSFQEILNLTRIEESIKLLLDTDKSISDIALETGFSHVRYYNKNFKTYYNCTPSQFRKKYKFTDEQLVKNTKYKVLDLNDALEYLLPYIDDYEEESTPYDSIEVLNIDVRQEIEEIEEMDFSFMKYIEIGNIHSLFNKFFIEELTDVQHTLQFEYGIISEVFPMIKSEADVFRFFNFLEESIRVLYNIDLNPIFDVTMKDVQRTDFCEILKAFAQYLYDNFSDLCKYGFRIPSNLDEATVSKIQLLLKEIDDSIILLPKELKGLSNGMEKETNFMSAYIVDKILDKKQFNFLMKAVDESYPLNVHDNNSFVFQGERGLSYSNGLRKPSYFAYYFLSKLGDEVLKKGKGYIVTKNEDDYVILLYNYMSPKELSKICKNNNLSLMDFVNESYNQDIWNETTINVLNLQEDYKLIRYELTKEQSCPYYYWVNLGRPLSLRIEEVELLKNINFPKVTFDYVKESSMYSLKSSLEPFGLELIILEKINAKNTKNT
ncbi:AraC-type DNA-binding protein [Hathewaya proteolytica DSM 3090]|uniref:AraC-type DNA-binding protein n=1 Tax=Hathewaya proteolytica DSM 3090 TaxID=1121331 RepID=A0A1M6KZ83_9CLOT|nr:helix-turn-helix domain-containing protein [Hathewaya proteolytica]SHJ64162.1 AraC-type DNA-binding protein [Hathewaya proteolytica DSM 3090]